MNEHNKKIFWDHFLKEWTIEKIEEMTLPQYSQTGIKTTFTYWLEQETKPIANILGGSSFKFGIYHRSSANPRDNLKGQIYETSYAWLDKYGSTKEEAFETIKQIIIKIIAYAKQGDLDAIDEINFSPVYKWKIAFLYQNQQNPQIISIFSKKMLDFLTGDKGLNYAESYQHIIKNKGNQSILNYSDKLLNHYLESNPKKSFLTPSEAGEILNSKYPDQYKSRQKMTLVTNDIGREIALVLTGSKASFFIECNPENNTAFKFKFCRKKDGSEAKYAENDTRHSNLNSLSEHLKVGNKAYGIQIETTADLEKFCEWYELDAQENLVKPTLNDDKKMQEEILQQPLNRILFGAAGTGKTFNTINHALSIIENKSLERLDTEDREKLKNRFDDYKNQGQIKFVTFHQSFSYEDFVEGIRAETDENGNLTYDVQAGVFKEVCELAKASELVNIVGKEFGRGYVVQKQNSEIFVIKKPNGNLIHLPTDLVNFFFEKVEQKVITLDDISQKTAIDKLEGNILLEPYIINGYCTVWANLIQLILNNYSSKKLEKNSYVLIIDEINRGNISRIFGELITLIEDSKRKGSAEEVSVTLPYSKQEFTVPNNVYIIGTMNSSDRSLTGLDIALRRRFTFIEMPPRPDLLKDVSVGEVNIAKLLRVINQRIEILLDRDHCIGHANFMHLKQQPTLNNLSDIFKQKIIPQLQEYFFDDWEKINLVLNGNGMLESKLLEKSVIFPNVDSEEFGQFEDNRTWELMPKAFESIESFAKIIQY